MRFFFKPSNLWWFDFPMFFFFFSGQNQVTQYEGWRLLTFGRWFNTISSFWSRCKSSKWEKTARHAWIEPPDFDLGVDWEFFPSRNDQIIHVGEAKIVFLCWDNVQNLLSPPPWRLRLSWILIPLLTVACSFVFLGDTVLLPDDLWDWNIQIYLPHFTITYSHYMDGVFLWYMYLRCKANIPIPCGQRRCHWLENRTFENVDVYEQLGGFPKTAGTSRHDVLRSHYSHLQGTADHFATLGSLKMFGCSTYQLSL